MTLVEELKWRGLIKDISSPELVNALPLYFMNILSDTICNSLAKSTSSVPSYA